MPRLIRNPRVLVSLAVVLGLLTIALWPRPASVDLGVVTRGPLVSTVDDEGVTRVRDRFVVSSPVTGRVLRIELEPGDRVQRGQVVARIRAEAPPLLDERSHAEAQAAVDSATAALGRARAEERRARATLAQLRSELARIRELARSRVVSPQELDAREADTNVAEQSVQAALFAVQAAIADEQRARARVRPTNTAAIGRVVTVAAPADGAVLKRIRESESMVPAGDPLMEIGDPQRLEIVSDLLSTDAVRVKPGARALIEQWGGDDTLAATVRRVEPSGFTKISALGVEEQRVNVILDLIDPSAACAALGDGYRVEVKIVVWEAPKVLRVPTSAIFRDGDRWALYRVAGGRAYRSFVAIGHQSGQRAEVISGVSDGEIVVLHPADTLSDGARVKRR